MGLAEQAELIVLLKLRDQLTGPLSTATTKLKGAEAGMGRVSKAAGRMGTAFATAGGALGSLGRGLGLLTGGALAIGAVKFLGDATRKAEEFGRASSDLAKLLDLPIESASRLSDTLDKFGLDADTQIKVLGRLNKNAQTLAGTAKAAAKFETEFGFSLRDANGQIVDANELLKRSADFFNSNATAAQKATVLTKLYGREWAKLIPLLSQGRAGIEEEERTALTLTKQQLADLAKLRVAQRDFNDAWGDLQVIVGVELVPLFTKLAQGVTDLVQNNREGIRDFVGGLANAAQQIGDAVGALLPVGRAIADAWNAIPADFRKLLIAGFVGNKILKMTIGFDPLDLLRKSITNAVLGIRAGVVNVSGPVAGAGTAGALGSRGNPIFANVLGFLGVVALAEVASLIASPIQQLGRDIGVALGLDKVGPLNDLGRGLNELEWPFGPKNTPVIDIGPFKDILGGRHQSAPDFGDPLANAAKTMGYLAAERGAGGAGRVQGGSWAEAAKALDQIHKDFLVAHGLLKVATGPELAAAVTATVTPLLGGVGNVTTTKDVLATLKAQLAVTKDPATQKVLTDAIRKVEQKLDTREWIAAQKAAADKIVRSDVTTQGKLNKLQDIERQLRERGAIAAADLINARIDTLKGYLDAIRLAIVNKSFSGTINAPSADRRNAQSNPEAGLSPSPISDRRRKSGADIGGGNFPTVIVRNSISTDHRQNSQASSTQLRYGPTPAVAGAS